MNVEANELPQIPPSSEGGYVFRAVSRPIQPRSRPPLERHASGNDLLLHLSPEAVDELNELLDLTGDTPAELFRKALGLYKVTQKAIHEGKAVGIAESPESLESHFVGI